ncbi:hypothetical protein Nmel_004583 [Mimus melanotis]
MDNVACAAGKAESTKNYNSCVNASAMENKYMLDYFVCFLLW